MKKVFCSIIFTLILSGCVYDSIPRSPNTIVLTQGVIYSIKPGLLIKLDSVLEDSRCPSNALCVSAGNAAVRFAFFDGEFWFTFVLNTFPMLQSEITMYGYRIKLVSLSPYPNTNVVIKQSDYKAELLITPE
ncbi:MAG TPA: hypothetical protein DGG95_05395 [Cytophagales bacterium]|jgi:hypothetical protein|nr:hypothetical protein [Cytophagales bacterium]